MRRGISAEIIGCQFTPKVLTAAKRWLTGNQSENRATIDAICGAGIGPLLVAHAALRDKMAAWSRDRNMWVRRAPSWR
jgi:hypothetical protein